MISFSKSKFAEHFKIFFKKTSIFFVIAIAAWGVAWYLKTPEPYLTWIQRLALFIAIIQTARWGNELIRAVLLNANFLPGVSNRAAKSLVNFFLKLVLFSILILLTLDILGFNITALVAGLGVGGVAVALAVQNILGDLFSSMTIIFGKPFEVGDFIVVGTAMGTVESIGIKTTRLRALSGEQIIFSNSDILKTRIHNYKRMNERRVTFNVRLAFETSVEKIRRAKEILSEEISKLEKTVFERCHFFQIGEYSMDFEVVYLFKDADMKNYMDIHEKLLLNMRLRFQKEGIDLAIPAAAPRWGPSLPIGAKNLDI